MNKHELIEFIDEYFTQDNHGTGYPIYFSIRDKEISPCSVYEDEELYQIASCDGLEKCVDTLEDVIEWTKSNLDIDSTSYEEIDYLIDRDILYAKDVEDFCLKHGIYVHRMKYVYTYKGMFLLESCAKLHLKENSHHYSKDAVVYCHHAWRCNRQKDFLESIRNVLGEC